LARVPRESPGRDALPSTGAGGSAGDNRPTRNRSGGWEAAGWVYWVYWGRPGDAKGREPRDLLASQFRKHRSPASGVAVQGSSAFGTAVQSSSASGVAVQSPAMQRPVSQFWSGVAVHRASRSGASRCGVRRSSPVASQFRKHVRLSRVMPRFRRDPCAKAARGVAGCSRWFGERVWAGLGRPALRAWRTGARMPARMPAPMPLADAQVAVM
jgi:hypothetical protein